MSWSISRTVQGKPEDIEKELVTEGLKSANAANPDGADQVVIAAQIAVEIIDSGRLGDPAATSFIVTMSGHGNPGHNKTPGWANDCINVGVYQGEAV